ncbi:6,7-dimethyl-8-ribityllumazine synthase (riboflavin synthase, alpha subunit) [Campylobacter blaseri]|uniref:Riboflavin synthase n=1 Tax=Campylobacter blaseri TaxID=2042961 RepID=A0A2P8R0N4_9BACT|nr:riboflavin synthase [Campylobacter blaseri]PSM52051.1 riboflavin synthase [Campylobacter blaseri]PSM53836.1 riboflavin synthase [Campylobacter blaseri]QKF85611.1 6,7-dimethyl-8-ribityllumazine synthase (riboflavin synthase, alpha subunit) [Campylobacter blaseri]
MFNGLIKEFAEVKEFSGNVLKIKAKYKPNLGDSVSINGACLSVTKLFNDGFSVELSSESRSVLAIENYKDKVHIEPAMRIGDRIDGHLVQGHIDGIGVIYKIEKKESGSDFFIELPKKLMHLVANKGSICVDGVSLTISEILQNGIRISIIPLTLKDTLFGEYRVNRRVNIETDLLARYVARLIECKKELTWEKVELISSLY